MKIRIVNLDFYMSAPIPSLDVIYSEFRGCSINQVPVIRIFGSTEAGHKICLHVHGVFPYIYIPYDSQAPAEGFLYQIASGLDKAINLSLGQASSNVQHIYKVCLVSGIPLYGYHAKEHQFLKIYFYNPLIIKKACMLLQNGSVLGKIYQPNEAHIPYILQFMIDYNLHGMSFIHLKYMKYRVDPNCPSEHPEDSILPLTISKMSTCKIEGDTQSDCILNREEITSGKLTINPGIKAIWDDDKQRRRNNDESSQIDHCLTQNRVNTPQTATHIAYMNVLGDKLKKRPTYERSSLLEQSVYPAETPSTADVINASTVETHTSTSQNTDNSSLDETITPELNTTDFDESVLNEEAQKLYDVLQDLRQDNIEKDSILSQVQRDIESEDEGDLSLPLNALQTPRKIDESTNQAGNEFWNDSYFDVLAHVPQLDGSCDLITSKKLKHKKKLKVIGNSESEVTRGKRDDNMQLFEKGSIVKRNGKKRKNKKRGRKKIRNIMKINTNVLFKISKGEISNSPTKLHTDDISLYFVQADDIAKKSSFLKVSNLCENICHTNQKTNSKLSQNIKVPISDKKLLVSNENIQKFSGLKPIEVSVNITENKIKESCILNDDINETESSKKFDKICFGKIANETFDESSEQSKKRLNKKHIKPENIQNVYKKVRKEKNTPIKKTRGKITEVSITEADDGANGKKNKFLNMPLIDDTSSDQNINNKSSFQIGQNQKMNFAKSFVSEGDISPNSINIINEEPSSASETLPLQGNAQKTYRSNTNIQDLSKAPNLCENICHTNQKTNSKLSQNIKVPINDKKLLVSNEDIEKCSGLKPIEVSVNITENKIKESCILNDDINETESSKKFDKICYVKIVREAFDELYEQPKKQLNRKHIKTENIQDVYKKVRKEKNTPIKKTRGKITEVSITEADDDANGKKNKFLNMPLIDDTSSDQNINNKSSFQIGQNQKMNIAKSFISEGDISPNSINIINEEPSSASETLPLQGNAQKTYRSHTNIQDLSKAPNLCENICHTNQKTNSKLSQNIKVPISDKKLLVSNENIQKFSGLKPIEVSVNITENKIKKSCILNDDINETESSKKFDKICFGKIANETFDESSEQSKRRLNKKHIKPENIQNVYKKVRKEKNTPIKKTRGKITEVSITEADDGANGKKNKFLNMPLIDDTSSDQNINNKSSFQIGQNQKMNFAKSFVSEGDISPNSINIINEEPSSASETLPLQGNAQKTYRSNTNIQDLSKAPNLCENICHTNQKTNSKLSQNIKVPINDKKLLVSNEDIEKCSGLKPIEVSVNITENKIKESCILNDDINETESSKKFDKICFGKIANETFDESSEQSKKRLNKKHIKPENIQNVYKKVRKEKNTPIKKTRGKITEASITEADDGANGKKNKFLNMPLIDDISSDQNINNKSNFKGRQIHNINFANSFLSEGDISTLKDSNNNSNESFNKKMRENVNGKIPKQKVNKKKETFTEDTLTFKEDSQNSCITHVTKNINTGQGFNNSKELSSGDKVQSANIACSDKRSERYPTRNTMLYNLIQKTSNEPKLPLTKTKKKNVPIKTQRSTKRLKNRSTQTPVKMKRDKLKRNYLNLKHIEPAVNIIITSTGKTDEFQINNYRKGDLGPNPHPKFRIVPAKRPYTFELKKNNHKYPNTTWTCDKQKSSESYEMNKDNMHDKVDNSVVLISNILLEDSEKYNETCIEKGRIINFIPPRMTFEIPQLQSQEVSEILSVLDNTNNNTCLNRLNPQEMEVVESLDELLSEMQENLYDYHENANNSVQASEFSYNSDRMLSYDDYYLEECTDYDLKVTKGSTSKDEIVNKDQKESYANMNNYRHEMKRAYADVCEKLAKSFDNIYEDFKFMNIHGSSTYKLLLNIINEKSRKQHGGIMVRHRIQRSNKKIRLREICNVRSYNSDCPDTYLDGLVDLNVNENSNSKIPNDVQYRSYDSNSKNDDCRIIKNTTENVSVDYNCFESVIQCNTENSHNIVEVDAFNFDENLYNNTPKTKQTIKLKRSGRKSEVEIKPNTMEQETFASVQRNLPTDTVGGTTCCNINRLSNSSDDVENEFDALEIVSKPQGVMRKKRKEVRRNVSGTCMPKSNDMKFFKNNINQHIDTNKPHEQTRFQKSKYKMKRKEKSNTFDKTKRKLSAATLDKINCSNSFKSPKVSNTSLNGYELRGQNINANTEDALNVAETYIPKTNKMDNVVNWNNTNRSEKSLLLKKSEYKAKSKKKQTAEFPKELAESTLVNINSSSTIQVSGVNKLTSQRSLQDANRRSKRKKQHTDEENLSSVQRFAVNQYRYLDGPNDSSSEDEDSVRPVVKKKCRQFKKTVSESAKYGPLNVQYGSPTKKIEKTENNSNLQNPIYRPSVSLTTEDLNNSTTEKNPQNIQDCLRKHRRKLTFSEMSSENRTVIEENLVCSYKLNKKLIENIETVSTASSEELQNSQYDQALISTSTSSENTDEINKFPNISVCSTIQEDVEPLNQSVNDSIHIANGDQNARKQGSVGSLNSKNVNNSEHSCEQLNLSQEIKDSKTANNDNINIISSESESDDMFSPNYLHDSFSSVFSFNDTTIEEIDNFSKYAAELYDVRNNFVPQAGSSKFNKTLTQSSMESTDDIKTPLKLSLESSDTNVSSSAENQTDAKSFTSNISDKSNMNAITPYQKEIPSKLCLNASLHQTETNLLSNSSNDNESSASEITPHQYSTVLSDQRPRLTSYLTICDSFVQSPLVKGEFCLIVPKYNPPQRSLIESTFSEYNIPKVHHQQPFYSDVNDVAGAMEVGARILKIPSNNIIDIPEFESNYLGLTHYRRLALEEMYPNEKITNKGINNYKLSFCKNTEHLITTVRLPPSRDDVELWLKNRLVKKHKTIKAPEKKKIFIPCSPGGEDHNESDDSLTISPCTPLDVTITNIEINDGEHKTLKSSFEDRDADTSPIIKKNEVLQRHRKRLMENSSLDLSKGNNVSNASDISINASKLSKNNKNDSYQITGVTLDRTNDFAMSSNNLQDAKAICEYLYLTVMCMELIVETRSEHKPDPNHDNIKGIVYKIFNDVPEDHPTKRTITGCLLVNSIPTSSSKIKFSVLDGICVNDNNIKVTDSEEDLLYQFTALVTECDPDILVGYEIEMLSWGYLVERGYILNLNLVSLLSRIALSSKKKTEDNSGLTIPGRIILDFWRLLRHEVALQSYTFENIVYHILHQRVPFYSFKTLTYWWNNPSALYRGRVLKYYFFRVESILKIMDQLDLIGRTSELAKLFGIQFFEVLSRGSQFRVESMMLRLAKPLNYIPVSPNVQQRAHMRAPESLPLIMEPESKFYADPVIVLDFQSLYPSMIIAYNYCFSTCLGRIEHLGGDSQFEFGATQLKVSRNRLKYLHRKNLINISPVGVAFVKKSVREGILPRMLQEILDTRLMVKKSLKKNSGNKTLEKILDARQLGLKLIANVTYGYTAANFSGRMPCIEVGDSVVSKGRETLQRAISLVEKTAKWSAKVVYGDTDSLFVLVAGRSREDAFKIGAEIAEAVTNDNPSPVKLKLEKVFHPCILQTKKRYVGYMYESPEQEVPEYCAKGIETVRRDGCPAVSKMLEKCLKILFDTRDVSLVRQYASRQFLKILSGRISIQDFTFAKEYRGSSNYRPGACVPALELARKWMAVDKRSEPRSGERVPYVIINGPPGLPLIRLVRSPREVIADPSLRLNVLYYITKVIIPPINRCFLLIGADVNNWFNDMPRKQFQYLYSSSPVKGKKSTISQYFSTKNCAVCGQQSQEGLCEKCLGKPQETCVILHEKVRILEKNHLETKTICQSCCGTLDKINCVSLDCPVYYRRIQTERDILQAPFIRQLVSILPDLDF